MISKQNTNLDQIINENGYDLYFKNLQLEDEIIESFSGLASYPVLSRLSISASSIEPVNHYLDSVVTTSEFLQKISDQEATDSTFLDVIKSLDVSESLKYMFGEGLKKEISSIEKEYNIVLTLMEEAFPSISFAKRYPFTDQMRKFCHVFLAHALKPLADNMIEHQKQLKKTFELFKTYMKDKKDLQSTYFLSKLAGSFLGGITGSLAVTALFSGMDSFGERRFSQVLSTAHQTWYRIQTTNITNTCTSNYKPRLHHLYLSLVGGLLLYIQRDLHMLGFEITEFSFTANKISVDLHNEGEEQFIQSINHLLDSGSSLEELVQTLHTFATFPQLVSLTDENHHLYIEKLVVHYLYLQAKLLKDTTKPYRLTEVLPAILWINERVNPAFSFLEDSSYKDIYETIEDAFFDYPDEIHDIYLALVENNRLYTWGDKEKTSKVLYYDQLSTIYIVTCFGAKGNIPAYFIEDVQYFKDNILLPYLQELENSPFFCGLAEKWLPSASKEMFITKWITKLSGHSKLENAIATLDYITTEKLLKDGGKVRSLTISKELIQPEYRSFLALLSNHLETVELRIDQDILLEILKNNDFTTLIDLLKLGLDPFTPLEDTYLLARITSQCNFLMADTIYHHCLQSLANYQASVNKLTEDQQSPYYFLFFSGKTYLTEKYKELINCVPVEKREKELSMAVASLAGMLLWNMLEAGYDPKFVSYAANGDNSFFKTICSTNHYYVLNMIHQWNPALLETQVQGNSMLREIYELGHTDLAWHFHEVYNIHDIGEVSYDDVENAAVVELNESYLILLNENINGVEDVLKEIQEKANEYEQWVIVELVEKVLNS
ncbi:MULTISPECIES: hypothetical protein [Bacillus]|uniref:hypothetical protein n=1 Tax=Bacillus TaxID=1386 RepID=UPI00065BBF10|nr:MULTISPECIES: hypothetical protein [Bacillus cereus group]KMP22977.1 hypothetical protein TU49_05245 [Bacillus cereus]MCC2425247.1 hypothetical protein [Bacillus wiedmannii]MDA2631014.1 hypothetical protein [Bacillus cereus]MDX6047593.1 hypothetical protein [Bacillus paranthracis]UQM92575.1 hypothetical protein SY563_000145 [Bacillus thuringiensis]